MLLTNPFAKPGRAQASRVCEVEHFSVFDHFKEQLFTVSEGHPLGGGLLAASAITSKMYSLHGGEISTAPGKGAW